VSLNNKIIVGAFVLIFYCTNLAFSEKLSLKPQWLNSGKEFTKLNEDEQFYFLKAQIIDNGDNYYKIGFVVYSYSKQAFRWHIWKYDQSVKDFLLYNTYHGSQKVKQCLNVVPKLVFKETIPEIRNKTVLKGKNKINDNELYWITIHWEKSKLKQNCKKERLILVADQALRKKTHEVVIQKNDLENIQLAIFDDKKKLHRPNISIIKRRFEPSGYALFNCQDKIPPPPPPPQSVPFEIKNSVYINQIDHYYFKDYGYVNLNAYCQSEELLIHSNDHLFMTNLSASSIITSPVYQKGTKVYFYNDTNYPTVCLWNKTSNGFKPLGYLVNASNANPKSKQLFIFNAFTESMFEQKEPADSLSSQWLKLIHHFNQMGAVKQETFLKQFCSSNNICRQSIQNLSQLDQLGHLYPKKQPIRNHLVNIPYSQWNVELNSTRQKVCFQKENIQLYLSLPQPISILEENLIVNSRGERETYYKIPIYPSKGWYYYTAQLLKKWMIFDDFVSPDNRHSFILREFKHSYRLKHELLKNNPFLRLDLLQGVTIKHLDRDFAFYESYHPQVSEISALIDLDNHPGNLAQNQWELHLFVAKRDRGMEHQLTIKRIADRLKQLNVKRIQIWEFCDRKTQSTDYNQLFAEISKEGKFAYQHHTIWAVNQFQKVMPNLETEMNQ